MGCRIGEVVTDEECSIFSGHGLERRGRVSPGQQVFDLALGTTGDDLCDDVGDIGLRVDVVEIAGLDARGDRGPMLPAVKAREECVLAMTAFAYAPVTRRLIGIGRLLGFCSNCGSMNFISPLCAFSKGGIRIERIRATAGVSNDCSSFANSGSTGRFAPYRPFACAGACPMMRSRSRWGNSALSSRSPMQCREL